MPSIKEIWDSVPMGQAIKDQDYLNLCAFIEEKGIPRTIQQFGAFIPGFWDMTPQQATEAINVWLTRQLRIDPDFVADMREAARRNYLD